jgi:hypothetical protein
MDNKQKKIVKKTSFADLIADSELETKPVSIGDHVATVRELSGRERFDLSKRTDDDRWDTMLWIVATAMIDPAPSSADDVELLKTKWVVKLANAILELSGMATDAVDEAENESASVIGIGGS